MTLALCFLSAWLTLASWSPYCDCWQVRWVPCPGTSPYAACGEGRK